MQTIGGNDVSSVLLEIDVHARVAELEEGHQGPDNKERGGDVVQQIAGGLQVQVDLAVVGHFGATAMKF